MKIRRPCDDYVLSCSSVHAQWLKFHLGIVWTDCNDVEVIAQLRGKIGIFHQL